MNAKSSPTTSFLRYSFCLIFFIAAKAIFAQNCSVNAGISETICENAPYAFSGTATGTIQNGPTWTQIAGPSVIIEDPSDVNSAVTGLSGGNTYTFRLSATCTDGSTQFQEIDVTVQPITIASAGENIASCPDNSGSILLNGNTPSNPGENGLWSIVGNNNAGVTIDSPSSPNTSITLPETSAGTTTVQWTITGPVYAPGQFCESSDTMTITNYGGQQPVSAGPDQSLDNCYSLTQSTQLNGSFGGSNLDGQQGTWSFVSGPNTPVFANANNNRTNVSNLIEGTYTLRWSVVGPCASGQDTMTITVDEATQDITDANVENSTIRYCDASITTATLVGSQPEFSGETVEWNQTSGNAVSILNPNNSTTQITGLTSTGGPYDFTYTITNAATMCDDVATVRILYSTTPITITGNGGNDIIADCGFTQVDIPFTTTGDGSNSFAIIDGPASSTVVDPSDFSNAGSSPLTIDFDVEGTYSVQLRRAVGGSVQTGCNVATDIINITISRPPSSSNAGTPQVLACNIDATSLAGNDPATGTTLWSQVSGPNTATISDAYTRNPDITGLIPGVYIFKYTITGGVGCPPPSESTVSVEVSSDTPITTDAGSDQTVCFGTAVQLAAQAPSAPNLQGTWTVDTAPVGATIIFDDENDPNTLVTGLNDTNEDYIFRWTVENPDDATCPPAGDDTVTISTSATQGPTAANAGADQCLASGTTSVTLDGNAPAGDEIGTWTAVPNTGISFANANQFNTNATISTEQSYILTWTIEKTAPGCQASFDEVEITIGDPATADAGPDQNDCASVFTMAASSSTGGTGIWTQLTGPGGVSIDDETSPTANFTFTFSGTYSFEWAVSNGNCSTASDQVTLTVGIPPTTATAGTDQTICNATDVVLNGNAFNSDIETGFWSVLSGAPNTPSIANINDPNTNVTNLVTGSYTFRWTIKGSPTCPSSFDDVVVDVFAPANAGDDLDLCEVNNFLLEATFGSTGTWTQVSTTGPNATISQNPPNSNVAEVSITPGNTYVFEFTTDYASCTNQSDQVTVVSSAEPSVDPNAGTDQVLCRPSLAPPNTTTLNGNAPPGDVDTATWRFAAQPAGSVAVIDNPNNNVTTLSQLSVPGTYLLEWNFSSGNCSDKSDVVRIEVFEAPSTAEAGPDQANACQLDIQMDATPPTSGLGTWTLTSTPPGGSLDIDSPNAPNTTLSNITVTGAYELTWTVENGSGFTTPSPACDPSVDTVTINFTADPPSDAEAGTDQEFCNASGTNLAATAITTGTGTWSQTDGPGVNGNSGNPATINDTNSETTAVSNLEPGIYEFTWTVNNGGCTFEDTMAITNYAEPSTANAGPNQSLGRFESVTLSAVAPTVGSGSWTQVSGPSTAGFVDATDPNTEVFGTVEGTYVFEWTVTNESCPPSSDTVEISFLGVDLELTKTASPSTANVGNTVTFTVSIFNNDSSTGSDATGVVVKDVIPDGFTLVSGTVSNSGVYNLADESISWSGLSITSGATLDLTFDVTVNATGSYDNSAEITESDVFDIDSTPGNDIPEEDDQDNAVVSVRSADVRLAKSVTPTVASVGDVVTFTMRARNSGPDVATGVAIKDIVPAGYAIQTIDNGGTAVGNEITWTGLTVNTSGNTPVSFTASVNAPTGSPDEYKNIAEISESDVADPDSSPNNDDGDQSEDDESSAEITLDVEDLELSITPSAASVNVGNQVTYTVAVTNNPAESANSSGVSVTVVLADGLDIVGGSISNGGVFNPGDLSITWNNLSITNGDTANLTYDVTVNDSGNYNTASQITDSDLSDIDSTPNNNIAAEDDQDEVTLTIQSADLNLVKTVNPSPVSVGDTVTFTLTISNAGTANATGVALLDVLPEGYTVVTINDGGIQSGNEINWSGLSVSASGTTAVTFTATVDAPTGTANEYENFAEISASDQQDPDSTPNNGSQGEDDESTVAVTFDTIDLALSKTLSAISGNVGDQITVTVNLENDDTMEIGDGTGITVVETLPNGFDIVGGTISNGGFYNAGSNTITWSNLSVANGANLDLTYDVTINASGNYASVAEVTESDLADVDSTPNNGNIMEDDYAEETFVVDEADLSLAKTVGPSPVSVGDLVTFTLILSNAGTSNATGVSISDILPAGYSVVTINNGGTQSGNEISWSGLSVSASGTETVTFTATVNSPTGTANEYLNFAEITASDQEDSDSAPNNGTQGEDDESIVAVTFDTIDLALSKTLSQTSGNVGDTVTVNINVENDDTTETGDGTGITVVEQLPDGFDINGFTITNGGVYNPGANTITWSGISVANGTDLNLSYSATINDSGNYSSVAEITASDLADIDSTPDNGNATEDDYAAESFTIEEADLALDKTISAGSSATPNVGDTVIFELDVTNAGPNIATNVRIEDFVPRGYSLVAVNNGGTSVARTFLTWDIPSVPVGTTTVSYQVTVNTPSGDANEYLNIAEITASDQADPNSTPGNGDGTGIGEDDEDFFETTPQVADLELGISVDNNNPNVGDTVTFSIALSNNGGVPGDGVNVQNIVPAGYGSIVALNGGTVSGNSVSWTGLTVPVGSGTQVVSFTAEVLPPTGVTGEYKNVAQIAAANQYDTDSTPNNDNGDQSEDDEDAVALTVQIADLSIVKTADTPAPNVGDDIRFTLTITNTGANRATGVAVTDLLPQGYTLNQVNDGGAITGVGADNASWNNLEVFGNGGSITLTYDATVNAPTGATNEYLNEAQITASDQYDPDSDPLTDNTVDEDGNGQGDDDDETSLNLIPAVADLSLTKIVVDNDVSPNVGSEISFEITVFNDGPNNAQNVEVEDLLPTGFDFILYSATSGIYNENTGLWRVGDISSGDSETLVIDVLVNSTGSYTNVAEVIASDVFDSDSTPNNNILAEDDQDNVVVTPTDFIDISLTKTADNTTPDVYDNVTFTLQVSNDGPSDATGVQVIDELPSGYTYVSDNSGGAYTSATGNWNIGTIANGATTSIDIVATVNTTGDYTNVAEVISHNELDADSTPNNGDLSEDDQEEVVVNPRAVVDLSVTKTANTLAPDIGSTITFTVTVTNDGPSDATQVVVTDLLETGYQFASATPSIGTYEPLNGSWTIGNLPDGVTETITINATVLANGTYTNTAELTDLVEFDIDSEPANNDATEDDQATLDPLPVLVSDLSLNKSVDNVAPRVGENVEFTIGITNAGPNDTRGVVVTDIIPSGYSYVSHNTTSGSYDENTGIWNLNRVVFNNTTETLNITVTVNPTGNYTNVAEITASDNNDPNSAPNNNVSAEDDQDEQNTVPVPIADLSLAKTVDNEFPDVSDNVTFTLTLTNDGPSEATGIIVTDLLESGYSYISDTSGGNYDAINGLWAVGSLASGASIALNITAGINTTGSYNNIAEVTAVNELDPDSTPNNGDIAEDDQAEQSTLPRVITDISVTKTVDNSNPSVGSQIVFTVSVTNDGPSDATGVIIEDFIASGYSFISAVPSTGSYTESIGSWDVGNLPNGTTETLEITVTVLPTGNYANIAELIALDTFDPDSSPDNNLNSEDDQDTVNLAPTGLADLSLTKAVDNAEPNVGDIVEFTLNISNAGDSDATGTIVSDILPVGYTYVSHVTTIGVYNEVSGEWRSNGTIPNGTTETLIILASVNAPSGVADEYLNIAQITASDQTDPDSEPGSDTATDDYADGIVDDDEASAFVVPQVTDIAITKTVNNANPRIGDEILFEIVATNDSDTPATNIGIDELLPSGYRFISATATSGNYDAIDGFWSLATLAPRSSETLEITVEVMEPDDYLNTASLAYVDQIDTNLENDSAQVTISPGCLHVFNEFSPNGDDVNDTFKIVCISRYPNNVLKVYNRWGNIVFEQNGYDNTWGGTSNGRATVNGEKELPVGTYYYILDLGDGSKPIQDWLYINR